MESLPNLKKEFEEEYEITKKFLSFFPEDKNDYQPHQKSMRLMELATHLAEIFGWPDFMIKTEKLDFAAGDYVPTTLTTKAELENKFEEDYKNSTETFEKMKEEDLDGRWSMYLGDQLLLDFNKYEAIRHALNQITHHRAQLGVYYRLNDIDLPGSYGPSAETF